MTKVPGYRDVLSIITTRHTFDDASGTTLKFRLDTEQSNDEYISVSEHVFSIDTGDIKERIVSHVNNDVDLCMVPFAPLLTVNQPEWHDLQVHALTANDILPDNELRDLVPRHRGFDGLAGELASTGSDSGLMRI